MSKCFYRMHIPCPRLFTFRLPCQSATRPIKDIKTPKTMLPNVFGPHGAERGPLLMQLEKRIEDWNGRLIVKRVPESEDTRRCLVVLAIFEQIKLSGGLVSVTSSNQAPSFQAITFLSLRYTTESLGQWTQALYFLST